jgi:hypothetical protein
MTDHFNALAETVLKERLTFRQAELLLRRAMVLTAIRRAGSKRRAATALGVHRNTLTNVLREAQ